jgi:hypothetical protein
MKLTPTKEQLSIIEAVKQGGDVVVQAFSGSAKTSTCVMVANAVPKTGLYLTFNKSMQEEARSKMPDYIEVRTWHSLAFAHSGINVSHKLKRPFGRYVNVCGTGTEIARYFKLKNIVFGENYVSANAVGLAVKETLAKWEYSDSNKIGTQHLSLKVLSKFSKGGKVDDHLYKQFKSIVLSTAEKLWKMRLDVNSNTLIYHDTYLKMFQLSKPDLSEYDIVYSDESQDSSMVMIDIIRQAACQKVIVGDKHQKIYTFRGSVDAMAISDGDVLKLSKSFRFGEDLAHLASTLIGEDVKGNENITTKTLPNTDYEVKGSTILYRTNSHLLKDACNLIQEGYVVNLEIDTRDFTNTLESTVALRDGNIKAVKHESVVPYNSWGELLGDVKKGLNGELSNVVGMVQSGEYLRVLGILKSHKNNTTPDVTLTTAHKSKGREFPVVVLADDFPTGYNRAGSWVGLTEDELNILYVACTRAKDTLYYNQTVQEYLDRTVVSKSGLELGVSVSVFNPCFKTTGFETPNGEQAGHEVGSVLDEKLNREQQAVDHFAYGGEEFNDGGNIYEEVLSPEACDKVIQDLYNKL